MKLLELYSETKYLVPISVMIMIYQVWINRRMKMLEKWD